MSEPAFGEIQWRQSRQDIAASRNLGELRHQMAIHARRMGAVARRACDISNGSSERMRRDHEFWKHLGVSIVEQDICHSGGHHEAGGTRLIFVRASEHRLRKRFTAAHEIAHLLLKQVHSGAADFLDADSEERICEEFASELLIARSELNKMLVDRWRLTPELISMLCRHFRVNLQPMLIALAQTGKFSSSSAFLARRRGHPSRPTEIDYRVEKCPFRGNVFLPKDQRLRSLGLGIIVDWAANQPAGKRSEGRVDLIELPLWDRGRGSGVAIGPAFWQAQTLAGHELLVFLELNELHHQWKIQTPRH